MSFSLLLHCCCGPCATSSIERVLALGYKPMLFFGNSNIYPEQEADRRFAALHMVERYFSLSLVRHRYDHEAWREAIAGHEQDKEGGQRCALCYAWNLREAKAEADRQGIPYFTTTLTVSPHKSSPCIFSIGKELEGFTAIDFKKQGGYQKSVELSRLLNLYRQHYCGCEFSLSQAKGGWQP